MIISKSYVICLLLKKSGFTPAKYEQPLRSMELKKKNEKNKKDEKHVGKLLEKTQRKSV